MAKFNKEVTSKGGLALYKLGAEDEKLLVVATEKVSYDVFIKKNIAYINDDDPTMVTYNFLCDIIDAINVNKFWKELYKLNPSNKKAPDHSFEIIGYCNSPSISGIPTGQDKFLKSAGYKFSDASIGSGFVERDYSALLEDPENKKQFDENAAKLAAMGATYESLDPEIIKAYETIAHSNEHIGMILTGPAGTGKSIACDVLANKAGAVTRKIPITAGTTEETFLGQFIPNAKASKDTIKAVDEIYHSPVLSLEDKFKQIGELIKQPGEAGNWTFVMGPGLQAYAFGYDLVCEEINNASPAVISLLNSLTDGTTAIPVNGIYYHRHRNFVCYMTMNPGYEGTEKLNASLKNRFLIAHVPAISKQEFIRRCVIHSRNKCGHELSSAFFDKLYEFAQFIEKIGKSMHENFIFSTRNATGLCDSILYKKTNLEEFKNAVAINYLNVLNLDNDNSAKLTGLKKEVDIIGKIELLYNLYDFAEQKTVKCTLSVSDFFVEEETSSETAADMEELASKVSGMFTFTKGGSK